MKVSTAALLASLAVLCIPAALALPLPHAGVEGVQVPQVPAVEVPPLPQAPLPTEVGEVGVAEGLGVEVEARAGPAGAGVATPPPEETRRFGVSSAGAAVVEKAVAVAPQAAGAGALTFLMVASSSGLDGLRALLARPGARVQQAGRFLIRLLPFVPLFSRIEGAKVLDNPVRARVHDVVAQDPGLSLEEVRSRAGIAWGTAVHHLRRLEDTGLLVSVVQSARRRYFAANTPASSHRAQVAALAHPTARRVADLVRQRPGLDQSGLCATLGLRNPSASKHLQQLAAHGLVLPQRLGRRCHYHPTQALHAAFGILEASAAPLVVPAMPWPAPATATA